MKTSLIEIRKKQEKIEIRAIEYKLRINFLFHNAWWFTPEKKKFQAKYTIFSRINYWCMKFFLFRFPPTSLRRWFFNIHMVNIISKRGAAKYKHTTIEYLCAGWAWSAMHTDTHTLFKLERSYEREKKQSFINIQVVFSLPCRHCRRCRWCSTVVRVQFYCDEYKILLRQQHFQTLELPSCAQRC